MIKEENKGLIKPIIFVMLVFCFLISLLSLFVNIKTSAVLIFITLPILLMSLTKPSKLDYVLIGSIFGGVILQIITIFYHNYYLLNTYMVLNSLFAIFIYFKKGMHHKQN